MVERHFRRLCPDADRIPFYMNYLVGTSPLFCHLLTENYVALLKNKSPSRSNKWWSQDIENLPDPGIQELLIRIVLEKPCNVTITELYDVFKELKPKRAQKHFERLWDILHLQDQDIVPGNFKSHKASIMQHEKDVEPAVKAQSFPASFVIPDQSVWLFHPDYLMGLWPLIGYDRQLICPCCYSIALVDPHTFCSPPSTMNGYISHPPDYMSQPLDLRALF